MKKLIHILVIAFIVGLVCVSCRESDLTNNGEGALSLKIGVQRELPTVSAGKTRATLMGGDDGASRCNRIPET